MASHTGHESSRKQSGVLRWCAYLSLALLAYYLIAEHKDHVVAAVPYLFLLVCPLMHIFMHGGHGAHEHGSSREPPRPESRSS